MQFKLALNTTVIVGEYIHHGLRFADARCPMRTSYRTPYWGSSYSTPTDLNLNLTTSVPDVLSAKIRNISSCFPSMRSVYVLCMGIDGFNSEPAYVPRLRSKLPDLKITFIMAVQYSHFTDISIPSRKPSISFPIVESHTPTSLSPIKRRLCQWPRRS
jgi:hypothetical protein